MPYAATTLITLITPPLTSAAADYADATLLHVTPLSAITPRHYYIYYAISLRYATPLFAYAFGALSATPLRHLPLLLLRFAEATPSSELEL